MEGFCTSQYALLSRAPGLELLCALLNNNLECYEQSLEFTEHVQVGG